MKKGFGGKNVIYANSGRQVGNVDSNPGGKVIIGPDGSQQGTLEGGGN